MGMPVQPGTPTMGMPPPGPGMGGVPQQNPGMGGLPGSSMGAPGMPPQQPGAPTPMGGMAVQPGMPMGPGPTQPGPSPTGTARITFNPSTLQVPMSRFVTAEITLDGAPDNTTGEISFQFDPRMLKFASVSPGPGVEIVGGTDAQESGKITVKVNRGANSRQLAVLNFQGLNPGPTAIAIGSLKLVNSQGADVLVQSGALMIEVLPNRAAWQVGTTELPGWGFRI